jgi:DNA replication initiation complex subunit (GINS family)
LDPITPTAQQTPGLEKDPGKKTDNPDVVQDAKGEVMGFCQHSPNAWINNKVCAIAVTDPWVLGDPRQYYLPDIKPVGVPSGEKHPAKQYAYDTSTHCQ